MSTTPRIITKYQASDYDRTTRKPVKKIVLHHTGGKFNGDIKALTYKDKKYVSAHYLIDKNGDIYNLVPILCTAWHTGAAIQGWGNRETIGIEISNLGDGKDPYTDEQIKSVAYLLNLHKILKAGVKDHKSICMPKGRKVDLSSNFPWDKLWKVAYPLEPQTIKIRFTYTGQDPFAFAGTVIKTFMDTANPKPSNSPSAALEGGLLSITVSVIYKDALEKAIKHWSGKIKE